MLHHPIRKVWSELGLGHLLNSLSAHRAWHRWGGYSPASSLKCGAARAMTIEINGMAHVILTVSRFDVARDFYRKLLPQFGMKPVFDGDKCSWAPGYYYVLFEDPDGIRLEVCFVPGAGLLAS